MLVYLQIREKRNDNINNKCNQTKLKIGINKDNHKRDKNAYNKIACIVFYKTNSWFLKYHVWGFVCFNAMYIGNCYN